LSKVERLLILAGAAATDVDELPGEVRAVVESAEEVFVVTPVLPSGLEWLMSDTDKARHAADERLGTILGHLHESAAQVGGSAVGDDTPMTAIEDHVRAFEPDHLLIALRSPEHAAWQERGLLEHVEQTFGLPMTVFEIDADGTSCLHPCDLAPRTPAVGPRRDIRAIEARGPCRRWRARCSSTRPSARTCSTSRGPLARSPHGGRGPPSSAFRRASHDVTARTAPWAERAR
jgi:hypothetical protein